MTQKDLRLGKSISWSIAVLMAVAVLAVVAVPQLRWRAHLVLLAAAGKIPDLEWSDLLSFMSPSSEQSVTRLIDTRNPYPVIRNPNTSTADIDAGAKLFQARCSICHAIGGSGSPRGPALFGRAFSHGTSDWAVFRTIRYGVPDTAMQPFSLPQTQLWQLVAYISTLEAPGGAQAVSAASHPSIRPVLYEEIRALRQPGDEWLTYSGSYSSIRHSALAQIGPHNVDQLAVRWIYQFPVAAQERIETSPIVRSGRTFVTTQHGQVMALEAA
ncbi:MAG TPA: c-type cytochrome, partial [Candidatus Saccharimonadales bacterium]|nr:c-type cytochrome [Candidatus Saccharimonadales bacterium]